MGLCPCTSLIQICLWRSATPPILMWRLTGSNKDQMRNLDLQGDTFTWLYQLTWNWCKQNYLHHCWFCQLFLQRSSIPFCLSWVGNSYKELQRLHGRSGFNLSKKLFYWPHKGSQMKFARPLITLAFFSINGYQLVRQLISLSLTNASLSKIRILSSSKAKQS